MKKLMLFVDSADGRNIGKVEIVNGEIVETWNGIECARVPFSEDNMEWIEERFWENNRLMYV